MSFATISSGCYNDKVFFEYIRYLSSRQGYFDKIVGRARKWVDSKMRYHFFYDKDSGYVWIDDIEWNGAEWNIMKWSGAERNVTQIPFHCLDTQ
jgi:hypothetical protein